MGFEQRVNQKLNKYPAVKKKIKSIYQHTMCAISSGKNHEGNIIRLSPDDFQHDYFFIMTNLHGMRQEDMFYA